MNWSSVGQDMMMEFNTRKRMRIVMSLRQDLLMIRSNPSKGSFSHGMNKPCEMACKT